VIPAGVLLFALESPLLGLLPLQQVCKRFTEHLLTRRDHKFRKRESMYALTFMNSLTLLRQVVLDEPLTIHRLEEAVEGVVAGDTAGQFEKGFEPVFLGVTEVLHVVEALAAAQERADGDDEQVDQPVLAGAGDARVGQVLEVRDQAEFGMRVHPHSSKHTVQKYKDKMSHLLEI